MRSKIRFRAIGVALVLTLSAAAALPQTLTNQQELGLVLSAKAPRPVESVEPPSMCAQYIDPVDRLTADELVRYALAHNGELAAARQMIAEARGKLRQAGVRPNPTVESSGTHAVTTSDTMSMVGAELPLELGGRRK